MTLGRVRLEATLLLALACVLAGYLWRTRGQAGSLERDGRESHVLPTFDPAIVRRIAIVDGESESGALVLSRDAKTQDLHDYRLGERTRASAEAIEVDRAEVASLIRTLDFAAFLRTLPGNLVPSDAFAAHSPKLTLEVEMDSASYRVTLGGAAPHPPSSRYAHTTGDDGTDKYGVVPDSFAAALQKDSRELRGRLLFPYAKSQTKLLEIRWSGGETRIVADPLGFRITQSAVPGADGHSGLPEVRSLRADAARTDGLFFQLARAGMEAYPSRRTNGAATIVVVQVPESGPETRLEIGGECHEHPGLVQVVRTAPDPLVGCTSAALLDVLAPRDLVLRGPWPLGADEIDHIVITRKEKSLDLIRSGAEFRLLSPKPGPLSLERGNQFVEDLTSLTLTQTSCKGEPSGHLRVVGQPEGSSAGLELKLSLLEDDDLAMLRREDDGACLLLGDRARWLLDPSSTWYESLELFDVAPDDVTLLSSTGPRLRREEIRRKDGVLALMGGTVDDGLLEGVLRALSPLRALRIAERQDTAWAPRLEVRIEARSSGPYLLRVGPRVRGGYLAELMGRKTEFVLSPEVVRSLETSLVSRKVAEWDPHALSSIEVTAHGVTTRFRRNGDALVPVDDAPRELGPALLDALSMLVPISAVRDTTVPARSASLEDLRIEGTYDEGDGRTRKLTVSLGAQVLLADQSMQLMTINGAQPAYYVDRAAVLAVLDLL